MFASDPSGGMKPHSSGLRQINLLRGWPSTQLLPAKTLLQGAQNVLSQTYEDPSSRNGGSPSKATEPPSRPIDYNSLTLAEQALLYGPDPGHMPLRVAMSKWLQTFYGPATKRAYPSAFQPKPSIDRQIQNSHEEQAPKYEISHDRIALTGGASQSLGVILTALTDPSYTRKIWMVAPAYFLAFNIFRDAGFAGPGRLAAVPELALDGEQGKTQSGRGPDVAWLRRAMQQCEHDWQKNGGASEPQLKPSPPYKKIYKHVVYIVPSFSNPSSVTSTLRVRQDLVRCARDFDALVVCDDVYDMLQWPATTEPSPQENLDIAPLPRLIDVDRFLDDDNSSSNTPESPDTSNYGNVVSNGTFSKIVGPGCRVGWVEGSPDLAFVISKAATTMSGGSPGHLVSTFVCDMLERGTLQQHVREVLRPKYAERWTRLVAAVQDELAPLGVTMPPLPPPPPPNDDDDDNSSDVVVDGDNIVSSVSRAGGYFIWLNLPHGLSATEVARKCMEEENLIVAGGRLFQVPGVSGDENDFDTSIRLCFAWEAPPELEEGVHRLAKVLWKMLAEPRSRVAAAAATDDASNKAAILENYG